LDASVECLWLVVFFLGNRLALVFMEVAMLVLLLVDFWQDVHESDVEQRADSNQKDVPSPPVECLLRLFVVSDVIRCTSLLIFEHVEGNESSQG